MELYNIENNQEYLNLQVELIAMQRWVQDTGQRVAILFEGRDTAGKGGAIMRFVRYLNPRGYRIVALPKPTEMEKGQWYFQRYIQQLPNRGEIVLFDRSWYNRAVVEPVMNFCSSEQYEVFMKNVVTVEKMLVEDGIHIFKLWFSIDEQEQKKRLEERITDPLKKWKLSTVDMEAQLKWNTYTHYKMEMFAQTSWQGAPWIILKGNDKENARLEGIRHVLTSLNYPDKGQTGERLSPDGNIVTHAEIRRD
ncbi:polyphosphate kinase 2 [Reichenbachiella agarivorans]|uniref:ADP/GDP-polyphosphate phosphotransferase n=1 Tax=Reichenbachiella agarivorans TaxID=2979464 RepID=A0ABY6CP80_9BACT|nr:polyphosphate kinase 2 [Reichenbachiella agarivorans]UXP32328.1 polyphosphate kinase 2 [Reichenbachiella agarivorans]